jgi:hypothetical protein
MPAPLLTLNDAWRRFERAAIEAGQSRSARELARRAFYGGAEVSIDFVTATAAELRPGQLDGLKREAIAGAIKAERPCI